MLGDVFGFLDDELGVFEEVFFGESPEDIGVSGNVTLGTDRQFLSPEELEEEVLGISGTVLAREDRHNNDSKLSLFQGDVRELGLKERPDAIKADPTSVSCEFVSTHRTSVVRVLEGRGDVLHSFTVGFVVEFNNHSYSTGVFLSVLFIVKLHLLFDIVDVFYLNWL